ncbi:MAG: antibiotic biosynthesis monooxygenase [Alphaproteobacteria bacterium]
MIIRVFRARVVPGKEKEFEEKLRSVSIPLTKSQAGVSSVYAGGSLSSQKGEYVFISTWENLDDLKKFVGENWDKPYLPSTVAPLVAEAWVSHYQNIA